MSKKKKIVLSVVIILIILAFGVFALFKANVLGNKATKLPQTEEISVVPTMQDEITSDSSWCGTFQLVWNDMKNEVVKQDIVFTPQEKMIENLNKETFKEDMISEDYYYKTYGIKTLALKEQIEEEIKEKFNQTSDILNDFDWSEDGSNGLRRYFFYTMLYRKFEFLQQFDSLEKGTFGKKYDDIEYFGIDENTKNAVGNQIDVLYYNSQDDFAIVINTKTDDEVIFCKNPQGRNFEEIYNNMNEKASKYTGNSSFLDVDEFKAPKLAIDEKREYTEVEGKTFATEQGEAEIEQAIQTIQFSLDEKGGEIKSEAGMFMMGQSIDASEPKKEKPRYFYVDNTFAIFLREKGKSMPYFAGRVEDISKFQ